MKTMVRPETVKFGTVTQCGKHWAFVQTENGAEIRLFWSQLRQVEDGPGGSIVFATGQKQTVRKGDRVAFVPQKEGLWLWARKSDFDPIHDGLMKEPPPMTPTLPTPVINLEQEMAALGSERVRNWKRRYSQKEATVRQLVGRAG